MTTYHIQNTGKAFTITARTGNGVAERNVEIAYGATTDPETFNAACRLVAHANVSLALAQAVERVGEISNSKDPASLL